MNETKSKLISMAVLLGLFLTAVAFASHYDRSERGFDRQQTNSQQNTNTGKKKKNKGNSNMSSNSMMNSNMMNSNTEPNTNGTPQ